MRFSGIRTKHCFHPFGHLFFAETGKFFTFVRTESFYSALKANEDIALVQNKRVFDDLDDIKIDDENDVVLVDGNYETFGDFTIRTQFQERTHAEVGFMFDELMKALDLTNEDVSVNYIHPHNILVAKPSLVKDYLTFLEDFLTPLFKEDYQQKYGALIAERALHLWCVKNRKNIIGKAFHVND